MRQGTDGRLERCTLLECVKSLLSLLQFEMRVINAQNKEEIINTRELLAQLNGNVCILKPGIKAHNVME